MEPPPLYITLFGLGTMLGLLLVLRVGQRALGAAMHAELAQGNTARRLLQVGQVLWVFLIASSSVKSGLRVEGILPDVLRVGASSVGALALRRGGDWDFFYDDRRHFAEPHIKWIIGAGTLSVRAGCRPKRLAASLTSASPLTVFAAECRRCQTSFKPATRTSWCRSRGAGQP